MALAGIKLDRQKIIIVAGAAVTVSVSVAVAAGVGWWLGGRFVKKKYRDRRLNPQAKQQPSHSEHMSSFSSQEWNSLPAEGERRDSVRIDFQSSGDVRQRKVSIPQVPVQHPVTSGPVSSYDDNADVQENIVLVMVGLPGRGKTAVANRTARYLAFFHGAEVEVFNVGDKRRRAKGYMKGEEYDFRNRKNMDQRMKYSYDTLQDMKDFLKQKNGRIGIFDANNVTRDRRKWILQELQDLDGRAQVIFVELVNKRAMIYQAEMAEDDVKSASKPRDSVEDYKKRVAHYMDFYEPLASGGRLDDPEQQYAYIKCIENGTQIILNKIKGYMPGRITQFITNCCHVHWMTQKKLYFSRHGQSEYNAAGRIGGDSDLTEMGERYALALKEFAEERICVDSETRKAIPARLWTSTLKRTVRTARHISTSVIQRDNGEPWIQMKARHWSNLDEIYAGACDGLTYAEIKERYAKEAAARKKNKLAYRYPRGESYLDVIQRLEPIIQEIERHRESLLIVGHQGILRMIYAFYKGIDREQAPHQTLELNHVIELNPHAYRTNEKIYNLLPYEEAGDDGQKQH
mmetsp:Transcript_100993/g.289970  ORF Transcript_100993/g.289970 Transcript_100993/m.289970 type:complete len:572 (+) Transcript_100993:166-1881(+)|eukprot:CAMPEP_0119477410 /NCGR_PEP_ID=MMETSP1344-20130328/7552_1 /TAXON_ID=236787 /ORGANISM="Florenciella parvula, Strain CCMP2471" /LENGTH=571 /DNA_ID=CAMNT_0007511381 /DNA_START=150 /DNA_END=1865 /DNA_ORIENTATION=+